MGWKFFKMEAGQANLLNSAAVKLQSKVEEECKSSVQSPSSGNRSEESEDNIKEIEIVRRLLQLGSTRKYKFQPLQKSSSISGSHTGSENSGYSGYESNSIEDESQHTGMDGDVTTSPGFERILMLVNDRAGLWDAELAMAIMEAAGIDDADVLVEETSRDLRAVRKLSVGLRENVNRCREALAVIRDVALGDSAQISQNRHYDETDQSELSRARERFLSELSLVFSGASQYFRYPKNEEERDSRKSSMKILSRAGMELDDLAGWASAINSSATTGSNDKRRRCGDVAAEYQKGREDATKGFLDKTSALLKDYDNRIESMDSFVYLHCVCIQVEKHFSQRRNLALQAWEKKTDITTAINIATKKRLPLLVKELKSKLASLGPEVSHTNVKEAKERHLGSKALKGELEALASRRFNRLKRASLDRVRSLVKLWTEHEQSAARREIKSLDEAIKEVEQAVSINEIIIKADGGAHLFALSGKTGQGVSSNSTAFSLIGDKVNTKKK